MADGHNGRLPGGDCDYEKHFDLMREGGLVADGTGYW